MKNILRVVVGSLILTTVSSGDILRNKHTSAIENIGYGKKTGKAIEWTDCHGKKKTYDATLYVFEEGNNCKISRSKKGKKSTRHD
jgi:hypothetical protein